MIKGWIRAYQDEYKYIKAKGFSNDARMEFRLSFKTLMKVDNKESANTIDEIPWGVEVEMFSKLSSSLWAKIKHNNKEGYVRTSHIVEVAYIRKTSDASEGLKHSMRLLYKEEEYKSLLWGDLVQIIKRGEKQSHIRARGYEGIINTALLTNDSLLETYFIDVEQGDGVLVKTSDGRHMLIDGGLEREKQQTGKNAADFVDWKFFVDYGGHTIKLDSMMASHSDNDHYGGLHDLLRKKNFSVRELDCSSVEVGTFHHPGLSRWSKPKGTDGLGKVVKGFFVTLLGDRLHAEKSLNKNSNELLTTRGWGSFIKDVLGNSESTKVERLLVDKDELNSGKPLPELWSEKDGCSIKVLGPVAIKLNGKHALPDLGKKSINTNGHSICLRIDYKNAKILLTGDLNKASMDWLRECYKERMSEWECDVAKACHHGSHDISYRFLEKINAAATIISSGDAGGHGHPRPEIVGASSVTGYKSIDRNSDKLLTPLVYMTEIERSVSLGAINKVDYKNLNVQTIGGDIIAHGSVTGRHLDEFNDKAYLTPETRIELKKITDKKRQVAFLKKIKKQQAPLLEKIQQGFFEKTTSVKFNLTVPQGAVSTRNKEKTIWNAKLMEKNHYGLVNVRTDGHLIMCATLNEVEDGWTIHSFPARF